MHHTYLPFPQELKIFTGFCIYPYHLPTGSKILGLNSSVINSSCLLALNLKHNIQYLRLYMDHIHKNSKNLYERLIQNFSFGLIFSIVILSFLVQVFPQKNLSFQFHLYLIQRYFSITLAIILLFNSILMYHFHLSHHQRTHQL